MPRKTVVIGGRSLVLDARPDRLDLRDLPYRPPLGDLPAKYPDDAQLASWLPAYAKAKMVRDQGPDGACTGFGLAAVIDYLYFMRAGCDTQDRESPVSPAMLYQLARLYDEWPGEDYEGSSCRGALKGWHRHGVCRETLWPYALKRGKRVFVAPLSDSKQPDAIAHNWDVDALQRILGVYYRIDPRSIVDMQAAICDTGAIYVSSVVHRGWAVRTRKRLRGHADLARITHVPKPSEKDAGGHAFAIVGYNELGFVVQNSWGPDWGSYGFALLPYDDWVSHGDDAWVFTLGVPRHLSAQRPAKARATKAAKKGKKQAAKDAVPVQDRTVRSPHFFVPSSNDSDAVSMERPVGLIAGDDALTRRYRDVPEHLRPLETDDAYPHTIVMDRGFPLRNDITAENAATALHSAVVTRPMTWLQARNSNKLLIYAHGGLNTESGSIARIRALAPYALDNAIYPLFLTWRSGSMETVSDIVEEYFAKIGIGARGMEPARGWLDRITEKTDRLLEVALRTAGGALWSQMKLNATRASAHGDGAVRLMVAKLAELRAQRPDLEIHLIGHSAGAIVLGGMVEQMRQAKLPVASLRLFAPACDVRFALTHYKPAVSGGILDAKHWHIHQLSDKNERDDNVGPYRKSLLYLVSRSFEDDHKTPLLGLERAFDRSLTVADASDDQWSGEWIADARKWIDYWNGLGYDASNRQAHLLQRANVSDGKKSLRSTHGVFDNAVDIMGDALGYVVNRNRPARIKIHRLDY